MSIKSGIGHSGENGKEADLGLGVAAAAVAAGVV